MLPLTKIIAFSIRYCFAFISFPLNCNCSSLSLSIKSTFLLINNCPWDIARDKGHHYTESKMMTQILSTWKTLLSKLLVKIFYQFSRYSAIRASKSLLGFCIKLFWCGGYLPAGVFGICPKKSCFLISGLSPQLFLIFELLICHFGYIRFFLELPSHHFF